MSKKGPLSIVNSAAMYEAQFTQKSLSNKATFNVMHSLDQPNQMQILHWEIIGYTLFYSPL